MDHGRHASLVVATPGGDLVRYAYGDWRYYVQRDTGMDSALAALFLDVAGASALPKMDAQSIRGLLTGERKEHRPFVVSGLNQWRAAYDGRWKLVENADGDKRLFDLENDPWEDENVAAEHPEHLARLEANLK